MKNIKISLFFPTSFLLLMVILCTNMNCSPPQNFVPNWQIGDKWSVEYTSFMNAPAKEVTVTDIQLVDTAQYEVVSLTNVNNENIFQVKVLLGATRKNYILNVYSNEFVLKSIDEVFGTPSDTLTFENYYGKESVLFTQTFGDIIADFPKIPDTSGQRTIQVGEEPSFNQKNVLANNLDITLSTLIDDEQIESTQTWESGKLWWISASRSRASQIKITGKLLP